MNKDELMQKLAIAISEGDSEASASIALEIIEAGIDPLEAILKGATHGLDIVGERFERLDAFLPDLMRAGDAMKTCVTIFREKMPAADLSKAGLGKIVIGTVFGDIHDIGKNLVTTMLSAAGFEIHDMGIKVAVKEFAKKAEEVGADIIALSALLTNTSHYQRMVIEYLRDAGLREKYYVIVWGSVVSPEFASEIGADGYARTAVGAAELAKKLVSASEKPPVAETVIINH
jgi:methylmalonyl-CoA mutase cobalamin-binding domain/chain